ncbi:MAG: GreA/GreB family elongation factor [Candidatus Saccharimonadales bacterium]
MNTTETIYLSKKGFKDLKKSIAQLERDRRRTILELHEQDKTDSHDSRLARVEMLARLDGIETELASKQALANSAKMYPRKRDAALVAIGSVVELIDSTGRRFVYTIVDSIEANPSDGRISSKSPLGQNLLGKTISDTVSWDRANQSKLQLVRVS